MVEAVAQEIERLDALVGWMRRTGVSTYAAPDGLRVDLGPPPEPLRPVAPESIEDVPPKHRIRGAKGEQECHVPSHLSAAGGFYANPFARVPTE